MSDVQTSPSIKNEELLARFITSSKWFRSNQTVRQDAFIPHPYPDLSVTRHKSLSEPELWKIGQQISDARPATLYGRGDIFGLECGVASQEGHAVRRRLGAGDLLLFGGKTINEELVVAIELEAEAAGHVTTRYLGYQRCIRRKIETTCPGGDRIKPASVGGAIIWRKRISNTAALTH